MEEFVKTNHAVQTYHRSKRLSKKFQHKITSRTALEVKALRNDVHFLIFVAEVVVKNPLDVYKQSKELWSYFSRNEPENQKRPETLEELMVLLVR